MNEGFAWNNPKNYKKTRLKKYHAKIEVVPLNSVVFGVKKGFQITTLEKPFILNVVDYEIVSLKEIESRFTLLDGSPFKLPFELTVKNIEECSKLDNIITVVSKPSKKVVWAIQIPKEWSFLARTRYGEVIVNELNSIVGNGDFLIFEDKNGKPEMKNGRVVSEQEFRVTYSLQNFKNL